MSSKFNKIFFKRLLRHLCILPNAVEKHFSADAMCRIEAAIAKSEALHFGEIRFAVELNLHVFDIFRRKSAKKRAIEVFSNLRVWDTEQNNGVLIYLLLADHDFEVLADRGIHHHVGKDGWESVCQEMETMFRRGKFEDGVLYGIAKISELLVQHYPANGKNVNELADGAVIL
ncbi:MAG TPA: TPM domain-containing protein [Methylotenera sp.]|nr:TPM domain-containing protein [Methylotenera sp.]